MHLFSRFSRSILARSARYQVMFPIGCRALAPYNAHQAVFVAMTIVHSNRSASHVMILSAMWSECKIGCSIFRFPPFSNDIFRNRHTVNYPTSNAETAPHDACRLKEYTCNGFGRCENVVNTAGLPIDRPGTT